VEQIFREQVCIETGNLGGLHCHSKLNERSEGYVFADLQGL
jgi:hypothetical protein